VGKHVAAVALVDRRAAPAAAAVLAPLAPAIADVAPFRVPMRLKGEFSVVMEYNTIYNIFGNIVNFRLAEALLRA
jgi:ArsR family metal-binding transcriptional regulator